MTTERKLIEHYEIMEDLAGQYADYCRPECTTVYMRVLYSPELETYLAFGYRPCEDLPDDWDHIHRVESIDEAMALAEQYIPTKNNRLNSQSDMPNPVCQACPLTRNGVNGLICDKYRVYVEHSSHPICKQRQTP